jgi:hypothetical protein
MPAPFEPLPHGRILALLAALFALRVIGQCIVEISPVEWLPPSSAWASGLIPYPLLLAVQVLMLAGMLKIVADVSRERGFFAQQRPGWSRLLAGLSAVYAAAMALRYVLTMIFVPEMRWLGGVIPISFHFVLAAFLYTWARFLDRRAIFASTNSAC